mmetsp:Transcript_41948/g.69079  ORF Transcript_41948/g.69079 Transcript_41948/m.69079 type:complete len:98 (-) Transcript_41948:81-374(-)
MNRLLSGQSITLITFLQTLNANRSRIICWLWEETKCLIIDSWSPNSLPIECSKQMLICSHLLLRFMRVLFYILAILIFISLLTYFDFSLLLFLLLSL